MNVVSLQTARLFLLAKGFKEKEIFENYIFEFKSGKKRKIDIVGIKKNYKIAIDIGIIKKGSIEELEGYFDEAYNLSVFSDKFKIIKEIFDSLNFIEEELDKVNKINLVLYDLVNKISSHFNFLLKFYENTTGEKYSSEEISIIKNDNKWYGTIKDNINNIKVKFNNLLKDELKDNKIEDIEIEDEIVKFIEGLDYNIDEEVEYDEEEREIINENEIPTEKDILDKILD